MGIKDLLRFMKPYSNPIHIQKYRGKRVGIDAYSWLHKGAYSCSMELCLNPGSDAASRYLQYFMHRINLLRHYQITPVVVFDGGDIPGKSATQKERQRKKDANLALAKDKLAEGNTDAAIDFFQRAICITPTMAHQLIQILRSEDIEFVVAPYEADAQLAYLATLTEKQGGIAAVITEDSDLMAYGCQAVIFKMDRYGNGEEILLDKVFTSVLDGLSFRYFDQELFTGMCILAGCDFLPSVPGIGIKRAYALVRKYRNLDRQAAPTPIEWLKLNEQKRWAALLFQYGGLPEILSVLKYEKGRLMPEDYSLSFMEALAVFRHARVYDADAQMLKPMKPVPPELQQHFDGNLDFLGPELPPSVAAAIAQGKVDPITMEAYDCFFKVECQYDNLRVEASNKLPRVQTQWALMQPSCFTIFSANENKKDIISEKKPVIDNTKYLNEAAALEKLMSLHENGCKSETMEVKRVKFPNNNPFNRNKHRDDYSNLNRCPVEQDSVLVVTEETNAQTVDSQESFNTESSDCLPGAVTQMLPIWQSCTNDFQDSEAIGMNIRVTEEKPTMDDTKYMNAAIALKKKMSVHEYVCELETLEVERFKFPNNNPFNNNKKKDSYSNLNECPIEQDSVVVDVDEAVAQSVNSQESFNTGSSDCLMLPIQKSCLTDCQDSETSEMNRQAKELQLNVDARSNSNEVEKQITPARCCHKLGVTEQTVDFPSKRNIIKRKRNDNILYMDANPVEQASVVIDVDELDVMCITTPDSQESVKSKPRTRAEASNQKIEKNQKTANRSSESRNMSIFKFFKRLKS